MEQNTMNRRHFLATAGGLSVAAMVPITAKAAVTSVVVVGGGMAGATVAKYLRLWSNRTIAVTLVVPSTTYVSNIMSNLVLTGQVSRTSLNFGYTSLAKNYGITVVQGTVTGYTGSKGAFAVSVQQSPTKVITLNTQRIVLAPGIEMNPVDLIDSSGNAAGTTSNFLHAWIAGAQTDALKTALTSMPSGGLFVMSIPKAPYRCPPGPYERACVVADYLARNKGSARILVLDHNSDFQAEKENFSWAFGTKYANNLTYVRSVTKIELYANAGANYSTGVDLRYWTVGAYDTPVPHIENDVAVANIISKHVAAPVCATFGVTDASGFAPVNVRSFESVASGKAGIYIIGDASHNTNLPKAGHVGNQGAKICASAIIKDAPLDTASLTANSACYSPIDSTTASWLTATYRYQNDPMLPNYQKMAVWNKTEGFGTSVSPAKAVEASGPTTDSFSKMGKWYGALMKETFV